MKVLSKSLIIFLLIFSVLLSACNSNDKSAEEVLSDIMNDMPNLPDGKIYKKDAEEGSKDFFSASICEALYGSRAQEYELALTEDFAIYLSSFATPCEIAVFKCYSASDTHTVAGMCLSRISELKILLAESEFLPLAQNAKVEIDGRLVIMTMTE